MSLAAASLSPPPRDIEQVAEARQATRTLLRWLAILLGCALGSLGAWYVAEVAIKQRAWEQLLLKGTVARAEVTSLNTEGAGQLGKKRLRVGYRFTTTDGPQESSSTTLPTPNIPRVGDTFSITYLPSQPSTHVMGDLNQGEGRLLETSFKYENDQLVGFLGILCFFAIALALVIGIFLVWMVLARWNAARREEMLARDGIAVDARITSSYPDATVPSLIQLVYSFEPAVGPAITGSTCIQQATVETEGYQPGATLVVLYDGQYPVRHVLMRDLAFVHLS